MIRKVLLLFNTVRHLKPTQVWHQFYYRLKPVKPLAHYKSNVDKSFSRLNFHFEFEAQANVTEDNTFTFLNIVHQFTSEINWNLQDYGKLWDYNLQYFNWLNQSDLTDEFKQSCLLNINFWLENGKLKLEPYPVSLRLMNSIRYASQKNIVLKVKNEEALYKQLDYLSQHLEYHILGNHLLENAFALMMGGNAFNNKDWQDKAKQILLDELEEQILDDGAHFELSPMYHQIILFRVLELIEWYNPIADSAEFKSFLTEKAIAMLGWLKTITFKNGDIPHFNDSAFGISLSTEVLMKYAESLDLLPVEEVKLKASGYRKYNVEDYECIIDAGPVGPSYQPGHSHADALSFMLYYDHKPILVEVGTSTYQIGERRNYERSTAAHNTVVIANTNQSEVWGGFRVGKRANVKIAKEADFEFEADHDGYLSTFGVKHHRNFIFAKDEILINDKIEGKTGELYLHFAPGIELNVENLQCIEIVDIGKVALQNAKDVIIKDYSFADGYNRYQVAKVIVVSFNDSLTTTIQFKKK